MTLNKEIFKIAIPNIIANISIPLLGIVDTALMGRMDDPAYIGAIALGGIIFNILYWSLGFLRPGTTGLTAQAYGKNDTRECYRILYRSVSIGVFFGIGLLLLYKPIGSLAFTVLSGSDKVEALALQYFSIRILAAPAVISVIALRGWFFGMQDAISPMILTISANVLNIFISWYLVMHQGMGVKGVAIGTMTAQWITFFIAVFIIFYKYRKDVLQYLDRAIFKAKEMKRFISINRDMFIRNMGLILVFSFFTNHSSKLGDEYLAISQMLLQLFYFMSYAVDGFAYASESLVGKYLGSSSIPKVKTVIKKCLYLGLGFGSLFMIAYLLFGTFILRVFTDDISLISAAQPYFFWLAMVAISGALAFIWDGVFSGATASVELRDSMLLSTVAFFIAFYITQIKFPLLAIWAGMVAFMLVRSLVQIWYYKYKILPLWLSEFSNKR